MYSHQQRMRRHASRGECASAAHGANHTFYIENMIYNERALFMSLNFLVATINPDMIACWSSDENPVFVKSNSVSHSQVASSGTANRPILFPFSHSDFHTDFHFATMLGELSVHVLPRQPYPQLPRVCRIGSTIKLEYDHSSDVPSLRQNLSLKSN